VRDETIRNNGRKNSEERIKRREEEEAEKSFLDGKRRGRICSRR